MRSEEFLHNLPSSNPNRGLPNPYEDMTEAELRNECFRLQASLTRKLIKKLGLDKKEGSTNKNEVASAQNNVS